MLPSVLPRRSPSTAASLTRAASLSINQLTPTLRVVSHDHGGYTSSISLVLKAGSRYESKAGVAAVLKNFAFKSNAHSSALATVREAEHIGATLSATLTREHLLLTAECLKGDEKTVLQLLTSALTARHLNHELHESTINTVALETLAANNLPSVHAFEEAHKLSFRSGLGSSLYASKDEPVGILDVRELWASALKREIGIVGTGLSQEKLENLVKHVLAEALDQDKLDGKAAEKGSEKTKVYFGGEKRIALDLHSLPEVEPTFVIAYPISSSPKPEHLILPYLLGTFTSSLKWSSSSPLKDAADIVGEGTKASAFVAPYSDAGLLVVEVTAEGSKRLSSAAGEVVKAMKALKVDAASLKRAVGQAKLEVAQKWETADGVREALASQVFGKDIPSCEDTLKSLDALTPQAVTKVLAELIKSKPSVVSVARLGQMAYADEVGL
ncbi:Metalloenzyme, LuxS/M16 peptidase-like protein [Mrakia frigida]|uniref:Metalloenzyme, LuxS/M16 peptidase-like protein n=1 Tax=Mrakia frigida TaxID=29902 RepID=UPI003FCBF048